MHKALWWTVTLDGKPHVLVLTAASEALATRQARKLLSTYAPERVGVLSHRFNQEED
jgi:hypothetical protein